MALMVPSLVIGQNVREESAFGHSTSSIRKAAREQDFPWPQFSKGGTGTAVYFTFDLGDADITVVTESKIKQHLLLDKLKGLAFVLNQPKADFIRVPFTTSTYVDLELNDYLIKPEKQHTKFTHQVGKAISYLKKAGLPEPIVVAIDCRSSDKVTVSGADIGKRRFEEVEFYRAEEVPASMEASFSVRLSWLSYVFAILLPAFLISILFIPFKLIKTLAKEKPDLEALAKQQEEQPKKSLEEVQAEYAKAEPIWKGAKDWKSILGFVALFAFIAVNKMKWFEKALSGVEDIYPDGFFEWFTKGMFILLPVVCVAMFIVTRRRIKEVSHLKLPNPFANMWPMGVAMGVMFTLLTLMMVWPGFFQMSPIIRRSIVWGALAFGFGGTAYLSIRDSKKNRTRLKSGDKWYDRTMEMANQAGIRVLAITVVESEAVNAYATPWNTVGLTRPLLEKLEDDEISAVIAHELGHHKMAHAKALFAASIGLVFLWIFGLDKLREALRSWNAPDWIMGIVVSPLPMFLFILLLQPLSLGWARRRNEFRADAFAAKLVSDPEIMVSALMKMAYENQSPTNLKPMDEFLGTHPSISKRIAALREGKGPIPGPN